MINKTIAAEIDKIMKQLLFLGTVQLKNFKPMLVEGVRTKKGRYSAFDSTIAIFSEYVY